MNTMHSMLRKLACGAVAACFTWAACAQPVPLVSFPFDEGAGTTVTDTAQGLRGILGHGHDPAVDYVTLSPSAPSGAPGDNCITTVGKGFLMVDDSNSPVLAITNGPITIECWLNIDMYSMPKRVEGIVGYGNSFKMGLLGGRQVFTLFGIYDITNTATQGALPAGTWTHVAAAWEPGVGVHFYVNGVESFTAHTATAARPPLHNFLSIGAESQVNNVVASLDRVRIHNALLTAAELDSDAAAPKAPLANTVVAYNFDENQFPCQSAVSPARPTMPAHEVAYTFNAPLWSSDSPTGLPTDYSLAFNTNNTPKEFRKWVQVSYEGELIPLGANNTNYTLETWIKMPMDLFTAKRTIFRAPTNAPRASLWIGANRTVGTTLLGNTDFSTPVVVPNDNRWHHVAAVMENYATMKIYLDGVLRHTANRTETAVPRGSGEAPNLLIGQESDIYFFQGLVDRVRIYNNALTQAELDYPAIPGQAIVTAQPADTAAGVGGTATFSATVSSDSPATYQWFYRATRASHDSVAIPGATSSTLELPVTDLSQDGGFYFLRISNSAGVTESYAARLMVHAGPALGPIDFEAPKYVQGVLEDQNFWVTDQNVGIVQVRSASEISDALTAAGLNPENPVHSGTQALWVNGSGNTTMTVRQVAGFENQQKVTIDFWARPLVRGTTALNTNNVFVSFENSAGKRAGAIRFGPNLDIEYNYTGDKWFKPGPKWDGTGSIWYHCTAVMDYGSKTYDVLIDGVKINPAPISFVDSTSEGFGRLKILRGSNQAGMILDDLSAIASLRISNIALEGNAVNIHWNGGVGPYQLQRRSSLASGDWENVGSETTNTQATDTVVPGGMFYRVLGK